MALKCICTPKMKCMFEEKKKRTSKFLGVIFEIFAIEIAEIIRKYAILLITGVNLQEFLLMGGGGGGGGPFIEQYCIPPR